MPNVDHPFPNSIGTYLDAGGDVTRLPSFNELVEEVTFSRAAGIGDHQLAIAQALLDELTLKGPGALPADLFDDAAHQQRAATGLLDHYRRVVDLLSDERLAEAFDKALPAGRLERERTGAEAHQRRNTALRVLEDFASDSDATADELERVADLINGLINRRAAR